MENLLQYEFAIYLMGLSMSLFMALYFFTDSRDKTTTTKSPRRFLAGLLLVYSVSFLDGTLVASQINYKYPHILGIFVPLYFLIGPFLYFYIRDVSSNETYVLKRPTLKHFAAPALSMILLIPFFILSTDEKQLIFTANIIGETETLLPWVAIFSVMIIQIILPIHILFYLVQSFRVLLKYFKNLKEFFSNVDDNQLGWLRILIIMLSASWALYTYQTFMAWPGNTDGEIRLLTSIVNVGMIYFLCFKGLRQVAVFRDQVMVKQPQKESAETKNIKNNKQKYAKSALSEDDADRILMKLQKALSIDKIYCDSMLSLRGLSDHTKISPNYISQVINQKTDSNFFDYINKFRIDEAKHKLVNNDEKESILDIAYMVGFNSKSTFNTAFKRHTGLTPSEFRRKKIMINEAAE